MSSAEDKLKSGPAAKVSIFPVGDASRGNDALIVTIKTVDRPVQNASRTQLSESFRRSLKASVAPVKKPSKEHSTKKMSTTNKSGSVGSPKSPTVSSFAASQVQSSAPCLKHAAENISRKASNIPSEKISLCNDCSKSMLSYIFVVQDFLDSLAQEICGSSSSKRCLQCVREEVRNSLSTPEEESVSSPDQVGSPSWEKSASSKSGSMSRERTGDSKNVDASKHGGSTPSSSKKASRTKNLRRREDGSRSSSRSIGQQTYSSQQSQVDFLYNVPPASKGSNDNRFRQDDHEKNMGEDRRHMANSGKDISPQDSSSLQSEEMYRGKDNTTSPEQRNTTSPEQRNNSDEKPLQYVDYFTGSQEYNLSSQSTASSATSELSGNRQPEFSVSSPTQSSNDSVFRSPMERIQPNQEPDIPPTPSIEDFPGAQNTHSLCSDNVDGIISTLSNIEREVYDTARNRAGWETLAESQEKLGSSPSGQIASEAFVTSCRNNAEAMGCLVLGTSLLLTRTSRTLCVLVSDGVSNAFRGPLSAVFNVVQTVRGMDSLGTTKLALLEQPDLGISFDKLHVWRLTQFNKCVYLNPDALVIQNCDELFRHEELSAVPDIGWPDCFNSGVFVFSPSDNTFWQLIEFVEKQGSYDGGDQGLLNSFFNYWSHDISKKLSFIYNLMANVSYTYTPAFKQFGRNVKIVQFHGSFKPWHVKFFSGTGQIAPASTVHPTYVQFVHIWLNIFRISVLRLLSQEIQSYAASQKVICAVELLRFFPLPSESEAEFYLTPPSVRLRLAEKRLQKTSTPFSEVQRRKSAEFPRSAHAEIEDDVSSIHAKGEKNILADVSSTGSLKTEENKDKSSRDEIDVKDDKKANDDDEKDIKSDVEKQSAKTKDKNIIPGSEIGDYQGMKAWEQGRMDYQGSDSSENIIKRLEFLMSKKK
ncbi:uncharacterized protein LOC129230735 [Uloborus diversus]|uniref:uncharacterized protein LOC129230735 n=1 Tax=Uloborus diversus TaxID=327109 RepID=UPI002408FE67|nr:uncharacterized protein LOC129230735 [Uloborus diversus]XP_054721133.1 uncharacterized protein LOC129230735 [Uloborus diversus]